DTCEIMTAKCALEIATCAADAVLNGRRVLIANAPNPRGLLRLMRCFVPTAVLTDVSWSLGMKFSPARDFALIFSAARRDELERIVDEHKYQSLEWSAPPSRGSSPADAWLKFVNREIAAGRERDLMKGLADVDAGTWQADLQQVLDLDADVQRIAAA